MEITYEKFWKGHKIFVNGQEVMYVIGSMKNAVKEINKHLETIKP